MNIILNNRSEEIAGDQLSIQELITIKNFTFKFLVTKINGQLVKKDARDSSIIKDGDKVDIIHLISGG